MDFSKEQKKLCRRFDAPYLKVESHLKVGISLSVKEGVLPLNGLRHSPEDGTSGWFIWSGEYSPDPDFFVPLHVTHVMDWNPEIMRFLGLAPGWRFLFDNDYIDVWEDTALLNV